MVFPNLYYKRTAATAKACYICNKPTTTVLATIDTADFLYTCPIHLTDPGFATREPEVESELKKPSVSPEEIARAKEEWEEKQRQKNLKEKDKKKDGQSDGNEKNELEEVEGKDKDKDKDKDAATKPDSNLEKKPTVTPIPSTLPPTPKPTHERYVLHRNIFALRTADHRRRRQAAQTKNLAPRLPSIPQ